MRKNPPSPPPDDPAVEPAQVPANTLSRRDALSLIGKTSAVALLASACGIDPGLEAQAVRRPNIVYIHSHDTGRYVQPYGHAVATPNLQRFASQGFLFKRAFSASPTCSPSRAALLTGMTPGSNGMWGLAHRGWALNNYAQTLPQTLRRAGYATALAGLQHIASGDPDAAAARIGYDTRLATPSRLAGPVADAAVSYLKRSHPKPFFLDVGFFETHLMTGVPGKSRFGYSSGNPATAVVPNTLRDTPETRRDMADYAVAAGVFDAAVGRVLRALETTNLAANTLVIVTTDHGLPLPTMKGNHTNAGLGVMLMLRGPYGFSGGRSSRALVSQIDLFPTVCDLLGLAVPAWVQGVSLMPIIRGQRTSVNEAVFAEHEAHSVPEPLASVRTDRYRYVRRLDGNTQARPENCDPTYTKELWLREGWAGRRVAAEELFDVQTDPYEQRNLVSSPAHAAVLAEMRKRLVDRAARTNNPLLYKYGVSLGPPG